MQNDKLSLSLTAQVSKLIERGMLVDDEPKCGQYLLDNNYFRLAGLWRYFQEDPGAGKNDFVPMTSIHDIQRLQQMEDAVRRAVFGILLRFEMLFRARFAFLFAQHEPYAYRDSLSYRRVSRASRKGWSPEELVSDITQQIDSSKDLFAEHARKREQEIPVWAAVEIVSFGTLSKMYSMLDDDTLRAQLCKMFGYQRISEFATVVHSFSVLRNVCAHGGRLWNRKLRVPTTIPFNATCSAQSLMARVHHLERISTAQPATFQSDVDDLHRAMSLAPEFSFGFEKPLM